MGAKSYQSFVKIQKFFFQPTVERRQRMVAGYFSCIVRTFGV
jgi:hypothetical protein